MKNQTKRNKKITKKSSEEAIDISKIINAKGRPMLDWVGKKSVQYVKSFHVGYIAKEPVVTFSECKNSLKSLSDGVS